MAENFGSKNEDVDELRFRVTLKNLNDFELYETKVFFVRGNPWKIVCKKTDNRLCIRLFSKFNFKSNDSFIVAGIKLTLISWKPEVRPYKGYMPPSIFCSECSSYILVIFDSWDKLMDPTKGYVENGNCMLKIGVKATALQMSTGNDLLKFESVQSCDDCLQKKFRLTINGFNEFFGVCSPEVTFDGISWRFAAIQHRDNLYIQIIKTRTAHRFLKLVLKLISFEPNIEPLKRELKKLELKANKLCSDLYCLSNFQQLVHPAKNFIRNNSFVVEIEMKIQRMETEKENRKTKYQASDQVDDFSCPICFGDLKTRPLSSLLCGHMYCTPCAVETVQCHNRCPECNAPAAIDDLRKTYLPS